MYLPHIIAIANNNHGSRFHTNALSVFPLRGQTGQPLCHCVQTGINLYVHTHSQAPETPQALIITPFIEKSRLLQFNIDKQGHSRE